MKRKRDGSGVSKQQSKKSRSQPLVKAVQRIMFRNTETKVCDTYLVPTSIWNTSPVVNDLCQISTGSGDTNRVGSKIKPVGLICRYVIRSIAGATRGGQIRVVLIQDMRQTTSTPGVLEYLSDANGAVGVGNAYLISKNWEQSPNFKVLHDEAKTFGPAATSNDEAIGHFKIIGPWFNDVNFKGNGASLTDNSSGRLFLLMLTDFVPSGLNAPEVQMHTRLYYKDA